MAQIVGTNPEYELGDNEREHELYEAALRSLIDESRSEICDALCKEFEGEAMLFVLLWNSRIPPEDQDEEDYSNDSYYILNEDVTPGKEMAYAWILDGMPRYR